RPDRDAAALARRRPPAGGCLRRGAGRGDLPAARGARGPGRGARAPGARGAEAARRSRGGEEETAQPGLPEEGAARDRAEGERAADAAGGDAGQAQARAAEPVRRAGVAMKDLTTGSIIRHLFETASFMLVTMVFQTLYFLVD